MGKVNLLIKIQPVYRHLTLKDLSLFFYDLEVINYFAECLVNNKRKELKKVFFSRNSKKNIINRRLPIKNNNEGIRIIKLTNNSPILIEALFGGIASTWLITQAIFRLKTWKDDRLNKKLTNEKLKYEIEEKKLNLIKQLSETENNNPEELETKINKKIKTIQKSLDNQGLENINAIISLLQRQLLIRNNITIIEFRVKNNE